MINNEKNIIPIELLTKFLANEANAKEVAIIEKWRNSSESNQNEFKSFSKLWNTTNGLGNTQDINLDAEWQRMENAITGSKTRTITLKNYIRVAAAVLILATLSVLGLKQTQLISHKSDTIALNDIVLPDGSKISLNAGSKISYDKDFGKKHRDIVLKGEGYFEVSKNKDLPFRIRANEAKIEVVGTRFNIKAYKNQSEVKVTVTEGKVLLTEHKSPNKNIYLKAGETGTFIRKNKNLNKSESIDINDISWKTKNLSFNNTPLSEVAKILSNTYHIDIIVNDKVANCSITVNFEHDDLASILKVLKSTLDLTIRKEGNKLFISGDECLE